MFYNWDFNQKYKIHKYEVCDWRLARLVHDDPILLDRFQREANIEWNKFHKSGKFVVWPELIYWPISKDIHGYLLIFNDSKCNKLIKVRSKLFRATYTNIDPELTERKFLLEKKRKHFIPIPKTGLTGD